MTTHLDPTVRHDFVLLYDVANGNPNGDPDNGNAPRTDPETGHAWVTSGALKRKVRNFVADAHAGKPGFDIYVAEGAALNARHRQAYEALGMTKADKSEAKSAKQQRAAAHLAAQFFDVRAFGAVMSTGDYPAGQHRGPIQFGCPAVSVNRIDAVEMTITRCAVTKEEELDGYNAGEKGKNIEMGSVHTVPYALFRAHGFYTPSFAERTGFTGTDLEIFWDALQRMWALDRSSSRGLTGCRGVHIFSHTDKYGQCHADKLFDRISIRSISEGAERSFKDFEIDFDAEGLAAMGVTHTVLGA